MPGEHDAAATGPSRQGTVAVRVLATTEILLGGLVLYWALRYGAYDESSLGTVFFLWGSVAALFCLLIPGLLLLVRRPVTWRSQIPTGLLILFAVFLLLMSVFH